MSAVYYNEFDPFAADWLENLISEGLIAPGDVDRRSIKEVDGNDLIGYDQCHFFAGIGGWSLALRLAGWSDDRPVWTGSCPCQPFSAAGKRQGTDDPRHLWPEFNRLIGKCNPAVVFGEQVASKDGRLWLAGVRADLEALGYAVGAADLCAAGAGAPHIRQRLYWLADANGRDSGAEGLQCGGKHGQQSQDGSSSGLADAQRGGHEGRAVASAQAGAEFTAENRSMGGLADADDTGPQGRQQRGDGAGERPPGPSGLGGGLADADEERRNGFDPLLRPKAGGRLEADIPEAAGCGANGGGLGHAESERRDGSEDTARAGRGPGTQNASPWGDHWIDCTDGKARRVEPGIFPLVNAGSVRNRVGLLRGSGNAIVPALAAEFIGAFMDCRP